MRFSSRTVLTASFATILLASSPVALMPVTNAQVITPAQRAELRRFRSLVMEVESQADRLDYHLNEWQGLGSQVGDSRVQSFNQDAEALAQAFIQARDLIPNLPEADENADLIERLNAGATRYQDAIARANAHLTGANDALADVGGREAIQADIERIDELAYRYAAFDAIMLNDPERAYTLITEFAPVVQEIQGFQERYAAFLEQDNADTRPIRSELQSARNTLVAAQQAGQANVQQTRDIAERHLDSVDEMLVTAVNERRPAYFGEDGGITSEMERAEDFILLTRAINAELAQPLVTRYQALQQQVAEAGETLASEILASNRAPADNYAGDDHDALVEGVREAWLEEHPNDTIVAITIPTEQWSRETKWTWWRDAWYFTDRSDLQAAVMVEAQSPIGEPEVHYFPVDIAKDHENNDALSYSPWEKQSPEEIDLQFRILPENM